MLNRRSCLIRAIETQLKMAKNNPELKNKTAYYAASTRKYYNSNQQQQANQMQQQNSPKYFKSIAPVSPPNSRKIESPPTVATTRLSPSSSLGSGSPRTSPGLIAGHYAGCKFTEPPLPSALPHPPQHWMQSSTPKAKHFVRPLVLFAGKDKQEPEQLAHQLKVLLKVQA